MKTTPAILGGTPIRTKPFAKRRTMGEAEKKAVLDVLETVHGKYNTPGPSKGLRDVMRHQASKRVVVRIKPERVSSWDHKKLGGQY